MGVNRIFSPGRPDLDGIRQGRQACFESNVLTAVLLVEALRGELEQMAGLRAALHGYMLDLAASLGAHGGTVAGVRLVAELYTPDVLALLNAQG